MHLVLLVIAVMGLATVVMDAIRNVMVIVVHTTIAVIPVLVVVQIVVMAVLVNVMDVMAVLAVLDARTVLDAKLLVQEIVKVDAMADV